VTKIEISLLGSWHINDAVGPAKKELRRKEQGLLAYLAMEPDQLHSRDSLVGLFWPEMDAAGARNNLRVTLSRLKKYFAHHNILESTRHTVRLIPDPQIQLDAYEFLALSQQVEAHDHNSLTTCPICQEQIEQAVHLYRGDFLKGFFLEDCLAFEEWLFVWRERLHVQMLKLLGLLVGAAEENGRFQQSEQYARRQLELDPLHEQAHRQLMRALYAQGQRSAALNQFKTCKTILREELGVEPEAETIFLQQEIETNTLDLSTVTAETSHRARTILPETTTPFIGREKELEELAQRLTDRQYRLISLVGPGGIGKTRLAIQAARTQLDNFPDGIYFVPLEGVQSGSEIPSAIAETMELIFTASAASPQAELVQMVQDKNLLLVIDNLEHVIDEGADFLLELINKAPNLVLLVTSRERINAQIEDLFRLRGLPYPEPGDESDDGNFTAVRLFVDRAHRINKTFGLTEANWPDVAAICRLVEGLPLGVELAATWVRDFSVQQIATSLQADFDLLETDLRDVSPRHRSIATVFAYSWGLLTDKEQAILAQLSVFRGGFTLAAAKEITGASPILLTRLRYKSLLRGSGNGRYTMHELLRQLSQRKLQENDDAKEETREKHSRYFLTLLQDKAPKFSSADAAQTGAILRLEIDNMRRAWRWAVHHAQFELLQQSTESLATFFYHEGLAFEGAQLLQIAIDAVQTEGAKEEDLLPLLLVKQIKLLEDLKSLDKIVVTIKQSLSLTAQNPELAHLEAEAYLSWAKVSMEQITDPKQVQIYLDKAATAVEKANDMALTAWLLCEIGRNYIFDGKFDEAVNELNKSLALFEELNHLPGQAAVYSRLAPAYAEAFVLGPGLFCDRKALSLFTQIDYRAKLGHAHHNLGETYLLLGAYAQAKEHFDKGLEIYRRQGSQVSEANTFASYANALNGLGQTEAAKNYYQQAIAMQKDLQLTFCLRFSLLDWGTFQQEQGWLTEAELTLDEALELNNDFDHLRVTTQAQLATIYLAQGNRDDEAFALADVVWPDIAPNEGEGLPFPIKTMFECYLVFKACNDDRADYALHMAEKVLKKTAVAIEDPEMRATFLNNVPTNKILQKALQNNSQM
jgi:predicted ATPase/DNA-binding SARP family transcriptional activator